MDEKERQQALEQEQQAALLERQREQHIEQQAQQQIRLQQQMVEKQKEEELFRLQQQALMEKARDVATAALLGKQIEQQAQQQIILQQQLVEKQKEEELFRIQQQALMEKARDVATQAALLEKQREQQIEQQAQQQIRLQQQLVEKQKEEELFRLQQQALMEKAQDVAKAALLEQQREQQAQQQIRLQQQLVEKQKEEELFRLQQQALMEKARDDAKAPTTTTTEQMTTSSSTSESTTTPQPVAAVTVPPPPIISTTLVNSAPAAEVKLPQALEEALAFKTERAKQVGVRPEEIEKIESEGLSVPEAPPPPVISRTFGKSEEDLDDKKNKKDQKNKKKKKKKKRRLHPQEKPKKIDTNEGKDKDKDKDEPEVEIEYVQEEVDRGDPLYRQFARIFETFRISEPEKIEDSVEMLRAETEKKREQLIADLKKVPKSEYDMDSDSGSDEEQKKEDDKPKLSKRKLKKLTRLSVAELKQAVARPDVVEMHDVTARDPKLLVLIKATRNTVPVPRHWCFKRKYLQGKRGYEKPPFDLPDFIKKTGIMEMRQALQEKEDQKTLKAKMRERVRPKLGKIDIDYQKLHDAFFKWQTKPKMTIHGNLYYEGKEFETRLKEKKPGELTDELRTALGMPVGPNANKVPPPWLIAMQRYGPPPSYPHLKIPGLNAPIPEGCAFGYHAGGWGKPPVDEIGKPLYGDVFGTQGKEFAAPVVEEDIDRTQWGELESESEEESEDEDEDDEEEGAADETGLVTPAEGLITPSGITSIPTGLETPEMIELRKKRIETDMEGGETPALYTILPEKRGDRVGAAMMGSTHVYDLNAAASGGARSETTGVDVALDPSELDLVDTDAMAARYEQTMREQQGGLQKEDLSDMVAEHAAKQKNKRKRQQMDQNKQNKKYKEFKF